MPLVTELDLPEIDLSDPELRGARWHEAMRELRDGGSWLARAPLGTVVLDRAAGEQFLRTKVGDLPGAGARAAVRHHRRAAVRADGPQHHQRQRRRPPRLRALVNPALSPRAVERYRPAMREILEDLWPAVAAAGELRLRRRRSPSRTRRARSPR